MRQLQTPLLTDREVSASCLLETSHQVNSRTLNMKVLVGLLHGGCKHREMIHFERKQGRFSIRHVEFALPLVPTILVGSWLFRFETQKTAMYWKCKFGG